MDKFQLIQTANGERPIADNIEELERHDALRVQWIADHIEGTKVIDIGCSTGFMASLIGDDVKYIGLDYNKDVIEYAKERYKDSPNIQFQNVSLQNMKFVDTQIADTIIAAEVIEHLENGLDYISKLRKMCKRLIITVPNRQWWKWQHHALENLTEKDFIGGDIFYYDVKNLKITREPIVYVRAGEWTNILIIYDEGVEYQQPIARKTLTAYICTKGRYDTTLPLSIQSILYQTVKPDKLIIIDDNSQQNRIDYEKHQLFNKMFSMARHLGIEVNVLFSPGEVGPSKNHQVMLDNCQTDLLLRVDDDDAYEADVIEKLLNKMNEGYDAVAPYCPFNDQGKTPVPWFAKGTLSNPITNCTPQFFYSDEDIEVEHFTNTFMYNVNQIKALGIRYAQGLSPVADCEETRFSHDMFRAGLRLCVVGGAVAWHYKYPSGGIRQGAYQFFWDADQREFSRYLQPLHYETLRDITVPVILGHGYGDTIMFMNIIDELAEKHKDKIIILGTLYKEVFDYHNIFEKYPNIKYVSPHDFRLIYWNQVPTDPIYVWMAKNKWDNHIIDAYKEIYINQNIWEVLDNV